MEDQEKINTEVKWLSDIIRKVRFPSQWIFNLPIFVKTGNSAVQLGKGSEALFDHYTDAGNVTTGETDLYSDSVPFNTLGNVGDKIEAKYGGFYVSSATATRTIKVYFGGGMMFNTGALILSLSSYWTCYVTIMRINSTTIRYMISFETEGAPLATYTAVGYVSGLDFGAANILKITGQALSTGAASNDIVAQIGTVSKFVGA